ncbi:MAG: outer membrane protein assembly factor BamA [Persicimonas sp.]
MGQQPGGPQPGGPPGQDEQRGEEEDPLQEDEIPEEALEEPLPEEEIELPEGRAPREGQTVDEVQVMGNRRVEDESILQRVRTQQGEPLDRALVSEDIQRLYDLDFFDDIKVDATITDEDDELVVTFVVEEKPAIAAISFEGNDKLSEDDIKEVVDLELFSILEVADVQANAEKIRELYAEEGYYLAEVDYEIDQYGEREDLAEVTYDITEYARVEVKDVTFLGNDNIPADELSNVMATREGSILSLVTDLGKFQEEAFEQDLQRLTAYYYDKGYVQVDIGTPSIRLSRDKRFLYITIDIEEGDRFSAGQVDVQGDLISDREELFELTDLREGDVFSYGTLQRDMQELQSLYKNAGYAYVNVNPLTRVNSEEKTVDLTYEIQKGEQVDYGRIEIVGNDRTQDEVIRRELEIEEGEQFSQSDMERSRQEVERLGYFESVEVTTQRAERDDLIDVRVEVNETRTGTFQVGAGFSSAESFIANAQISQNNLLGRGQSLSFEAQISRIRQLFNLRFNEPWLFGSRWNFAFDLYNFDYVFQDFTRQSTGGNLTFGYPISDALELDTPGDLNASATYKLEDVDVSPGGQAEVSEEGDSSLFRGGLTSSIEGGLDYDSRDNRLFPTSGQYHTGSAEFADRSLTLSQNEFLKLDLESRWYVPVFWEFVLRLQAEMGYVFNPGGGGDVPLFERYFVGGPTTVRGFDRYTLGPSREVADNADEPGSSLDVFRIGGNKQMILTAEVEFPVFTAAGIKGVVFADMGNAFDNDQAFVLTPDIFADDDQRYEDALRTSVGFGFRWLSPIAPLRFEWGIPMARLPGEDSIVFDFSIGNAF